jgi:hypothetical protein
LEGILVFAWIDGKPSSYQFNNCARNSGIFCILWQLRNKAFSGAGRLSEAADLFAISSLARPPPGSLSGLAAGCQHGRSAMRHPTLVDKT